MGGLLFGARTPPAPVQMPIIPEPTVMPLADDAAAKRKKRQSLLAQQKHSGAAATILSTKDKLG